MEEIEKYPYRTEYGRIVTGIERITPELAEKMLATSKGNRALKKQRVEQYVRAIKDGKWTVNGETIIFDSDGALIDGHHRLTAIAKSGVSVYTNVCRGVPAIYDAQATIDDGCGRSAADTLGIDSVKNSATVAAIVKGVYRLKKLGFLHHSSNTQRLTNDEVKRIYVQGEEMYNRAAYKAMQWYGRASYIRSTWIGAMYYYLVTESNYTIDYIEKFFDSLCSMSDGDIQPVNLLRQRITAGLMNRSMQLTEASLNAFLFKCWNAYAHGGRVGVYKWSETEQFPQLDIKSSVQAKTIF